MKRKDVYCDPVPGATFQGVAARAVLSGYSDCVFGDYVYAIGISVADGCYVPIPYHVIDSGLPTSSVTVQDLKD